MIKDPILLEKPKLVDKYILDIEEDLPLLDESIVKFIDAVYTKNVGTPAGDAVVLFHLIASVLIDVFGSPQAALDVACKDEKFMHWETIDDFNKMCSGSTVFPGPILAFISLRNRADPVYNSDGESFLVSGLIPDVDYTMCGSAPDKAILFNGGGKYINQLSEPQLDMYCGTFPVGKMQTSKEYILGLPIKYSGDEPIDVFPCVLNDVKADMEFIKMKDLIAIKKPHSNESICNTKELLAPTLLPREIVDKYGFKIKE